MPSTAGFEPAKYGFLGRNAGPLCDIGAIITHNYVSELGQHGIAPPVGPSGLTRLGASRGGRCG